MKAETALEKRIRRQVIGRTLDFFAATAPGLEEICEKELMSLPLTLKEIQAVKGGVEFRGRLHDCYLANLHLCTANRILMRIGECRAEGFPQMEKRLRDFPWELYLHPGEMPDFSISTERCRLYHTEAIRERFEKSIAACPSLAGREAEAAEREKIPQRIFIRGLHDVFHISIDSSGEHLHKRGIRKYSADAPLRETNAAAILKIAEYDGQAPLLDPMCGSGTFSLEAAMMAARIPPGFYRDFAFTEWPSFQAGRWHHLLREAGEGILPTGANIFASDTDEKACQALKKNIGEAPFESRISVSQADYFSFSPDQLTDRKGLVLINPPYGHRMGSPGRSAELIPAICGHLAAAYKGWKFAILVPEAKGIRNLRYRKQPFFHGGLQLNLLTGRVR